MYVGIVQRVCERRQNLCHLKYMDITPTYMYPTHTDQASRTHIISRPKWGQASLLFSYMLPPPKSFMPRLWKARYHGQKRGRTKVLRAVMLAPSPNILLDFILCITCTIDICTQVHMADTISLGINVTLKRTYYFVLFAHE